MLKVLAIYEQAGDRRNLCARRQRYIRLELDLHSRRYPFIEMYLQLASDMFDI